MCDGPGSGSFGLQLDARAIYDQAIRRCSIRDALAAKLRTGPVGSFTPEVETLLMEGVRRLLLIAMGKAAAAMLHAVLQRADIIGERVVTGVLVAPERPSWLPATIAYFRGGHPTPDAHSRRAAVALLDLLRNEEPSDRTLCLFLISGGASAMVELPLDNTISVDDTAAFHSALVHSGANIVEINTLRKHFSAVKGGRLVAAVRHLHCLILLVSDVPQDHLDALGSGPTLPDRSTIDDCRRILKRYGLCERLPQRVRLFFESDTLPETPKPTDLGSRSLVLLSQADLAQAAAHAARERGYVAFVDNTPDDWPAAEAAQYLLDRFRALQRQHGRICLVSTGEVLVRVPSALQGKAAGGRNQHFVLECAVRLSPDDAEVAILSCGSDGVDGNSTAAGAVIASADFQGEEVRSRAREALATFASNALLRGMNATVESGPTGLNLRDLRLLLG